MNWINQLIDDYYHFLKSKTVAITDTDTEWAVISTPFVGLFNDTLEIYIKKENNKFVLSDDGVTLKNLELTGVSVQRSPKRKSIVEKIILNYGINWDDGELFVEANEQTFSQKKHNLISAISEINDMYMLSKHTVASVFKEDVKAYLDEQNLIYTPEFISKGSTGLEFTFDFQIASRNSEIVIKSFNNINKFTLVNFLATWEDIKIVREKLTGKLLLGIAIINDEESPLKDEYIEAMNTKNTGYIRWTQRYMDENKQKLGVTV